MLSILGALYHQAHELTDFASLIMACGFVEEFVVNCAEKILSRSVKRRSLKRNR